MKTEKIKTGKIQKIILLAAFAFFAGSGSGGGIFAQSGKLNEVKPPIADKDLVIPIAEVGSNAVFYPVDIEGVRLEIIAVKAPDGTIRTAFNTCQVCYGSGRGYYKQVGNLLICQNCKNRFRMSQVEVRSGGCNPVPIFAANKTVTKDTITISKNFLKEAKIIFGRWRRG